MLVYSEQKSKFLKDVESNNISGIVLDKVIQKLGHGVGSSEQNSWRESLGVMYRVMVDQEIPNDSRIAIEYSLPLTSKRVDFIVTGKDADLTESAIVIELKQWSEVEKTDEDAVVKTRFKHGLAKTSHPSYQAWSYKSVLHNYNVTVQDENINLVPCAYLHNYKQDGIIDDPFYAEHISRAPLFYQTDNEKLRDFIKKYIKYGDTDNKTIMYKIDKGRLRPSKQLADNLVSMLSGKNEFILIDDQKLVFETVKKLSRQSGKNVLIVRGGPGTGKTVVAINLLVALTKMKKLVQYVSKNSAPREVYKTKLKGTDVKNEYDGLFRGSSSYIDEQSNRFDVLLVDEAHRLVTKDQYRPSILNQIDDLIRTSRLTVFFLDEDQKVTLSDIGSQEEIMACASRYGADVTIMDLPSQFRCNGSDGYLAWLDNVLDIRPTANFDVDHDYDFRVIDTPQELHDLIIEKNNNNKARVLAGYCWKWVSQKQPELDDIIIGNYSRKWNMTDIHGGLGWIIHPDSVDEVGCIYTSQGLELDYVGVIIGDDFVVRNGKVITDPLARAPEELSNKALKGYRKLLRENEAEAKKRADQIIKNTYRVLMSRGMKGCYIYCTDPETSEYFNTQLR